MILPKATVIAARTWTNTPDLLEYWYAQSTLLPLLAYYVSVSKVDHHGSDTSTSQGFLVVVDPGVSVGSDNRIVPITRLGAAEEIQAAR